jgi:hypothetical protein
VTAILVAVAGTTFRSPAIDAEAIGYGFCNRVWWLDPESINGKILIG